ncbi:unnamed protein product [Chrysoparadoxa australica]
MFKVERYSGGEDGPNRELANERLKALLQKSSKKRKLDDAAVPQEKEQPAYESDSSESSDEGAESQMQEREELENDALIVHDEDEGGGSEDPLEPDQAFQPEGLVEGETEEEMEEEEEEKEKPDEMRPLDEVAEEWGLDPILAGNLRAQGITHFFHIQRKVVPDIISTERHSYVQSRDMCVSAPTGSGKTLVYVLGVVQALLKRRVTRLRALVMLPSRDLALQVHQVFTDYCKGTPLRVGLAIGQNNFVEEQLSLVGTRALAGNPVAAAQAASGSKKLRGFVDVQAVRGNGDVLGGASEVDILVATPGRLLDHIQQTPSFTVQHLRYLVIDEADRLLGQSYQGWVNKVLAAAYQTTRGRVVPAGSDGSISLQATTMRSRPLAQEVIRGPLASTPPLRKMLFSATLTKNPQKLASVGLVNPIFYSGHDVGRKRKRAGAGAGARRFSVPASLKECLVRCQANEKPLALLSLLRGDHGTNHSEQQVTVVFASSVDSTHRVLRLLQLYGGLLEGSPDGGVAEFSSSLTQKQRAKLVKRASTGELRVIVCSDGMSRGMDMSNVGRVVNYDVPAHAKTYVHRVGRTARAGREGIAVTILKRGQERLFAGMRKKIDESKVPVEKLSPFDDLIPRYVSCLGRLQGVLEEEKKGALRVTAPVPPL